MANPDNGRIYEDPNRLILSQETREQVDITLDYAWEIARQLGRVNYEEIEEIAIRNLSLIFTGRTPEERARETVEHALRSWGISPGHSDKMKVKDMVVRLTKTEHNLLVMFAASPGHLVTYESAEGRFGWNTHRYAFNTNINKIRDKLRTFGNDSPIKIVSVKKIGYRADPKPDTSSASDLEGYPQVQIPNP